MQHRRLGKTGYDISAIGFGAWAIGGSWGQVDDATSMAALHAAADAGVTFYDTADVYGDGHSEQLIGRFLRERAGERLIVATKMGRRVDQVTANYTPEAFVQWNTRSRENLGVERLDLVQLHCPPTDLFYHPEVFAALDDMVGSGVIAHYGVSVERVEEGLKALEYPGVASVQIIYNIVRQRPADRFLAEAAAHDVGVLARVPMASGLLTGKLTAASTFAADDHRNFNRHGESFDMGETFSGLDYARRPGSRGAASAARATGRDDGPARPALDPDVRAGQRDHPGCEIPRASSPQRRRGRHGAAVTRHDGRDPSGIYEELARPLVHQRW